MRRASAGELGKAWLLLLLLLSRGVNSGLEPCPQQCDCRRDSLSTERPQYLVICRQKNLTSVPDMRSLQSVPDLYKWVTLALNRIERIDRSYFRPHLGVTSLSLESNRRLLISPDGLANLGSSLMTLNLDSTGLYFTFTLTFLRGLPRLQELSLSNNNIRDFVPGSGHVTVPLFRDLGLTSLRVLSMNDCLFTDLDSVTFEGLESLEVLHLDNNHFRHVPADALRSLVNLKELTLTRNRLVGLGRDQFLGLSKLETMVLRDNRISHVSSTAFLSLEDSLRTLDMADNHMRTLATSALAPLRALDTLTLTNNPLAWLGPQDLSGGYCLQRLELSGTAASLGPDTFRSQAGCLKQLHLSAMGLLAPPLEALVPLRRLEELYLDYNYITELKERAFQGLTVRTLVLTGCPISRIAPKAFLGLEAPLSLGLERTSLTSLEFFFDYSPGTFACINVTDSQLPCNCYLATIRNHVKPGGLHGDCLYKGGKVNLRSTKLDAILKDCKTAISLRNVNTETPPVTVDYNGCSVCHLELLVLLFSFVVFLLLTPS